MDLEHCRDYVSTGYPCIDLEHCRDYVSTGYPWMDLEHCRDYGSTGYPRGLLTMDENCRARAIICRVVAPWVENL
jgi:hypothetical protein